ncbi:MAG: GH36-type glycosyl hydrolase domain-containing protein [Lachnospiraceae bacterium]
MEAAVAAFRADGATLRLHHCRQRWERRLGGLRFDLPDEALCLMLNRWLPYQVIASRLLMRAGFEPSSGACVFQNQLQDALALLYTSPEVVRELLPLRSPSI